MTISQRIFTLLKVKNLSQKDLAEYTGLSPAAISGWKKRNTAPSCDNLLQICEFLGVSEHYLLTGYEKPVEEGLLLMDEPISYDCTPLSPKEAELLRLFRMLPEFEQGRILGIAEDTAQRLNPTEE